MVASRAAATACIAMSSMLLYLSCSCCCYPSPRLHQCCHTHTIHNRCCMQEFNSKKNPHLLVYYVGFFVVKKSLWKKYFCQVNWTKFKIVMKLIQVWELKMDSRSYNCKSKAIEWGQKKGLKREKGVCNVWICEFTFIFISQVGGEKE